MGKIVNAREFELLKERVIQNTWNGTTGQKNHITSAVIHNDEATCGRVFLDVAFDPAATAGISVDLYYKNSVIGRVIHIRPIVEKGYAGATGGASPSLDLANLSGFHFVIINHDNTHSVTIKRFWIRMWRTE